MGRLRSAVIADDLHNAGLQADLEAGLQPSPAAFRASGEVRGVTDVPGWKEFAKVFLFNGSHFPMLDDPDLQAEFANDRASVARGELRIAEYYEHERGAEARSRVGPATSRRMTPSLDIPTPFP